MDLPVYEALLQFNEGFCKVLDSLSRLEKLSVVLPEAMHDLRVRMEELRADASADFTVAISQREREEEDRWWNLRCEREKQQEGRHET